MARRPATPMIARRSRIRVRPPHPHAGLVLLEAILGLSHGLLICVLIGNPIVFALCATPLVIVVAAVVLVLVFVPASLNAGQLVQCCNHLKWLVLMGQIYGTSFGFSVYLWLVSTNPMVAARPVRTGIECLVWLATTGLVAVSFVLVHLLFFRARGLVLIEQDGTLCPHCAYPVRRSTSERCPECGTPVNAPTKRHAMLGLLAGYIQRSPHLFGTPLALIVVCSIAAVIWCQYPYARFVSRFPSSVNEFDLDYVTRAASFAPTSFTPNGLISYQRIAGSDNAALIVVFGRPTFFADPIMQIRLGGADRRIRTKTLYYRDGLRRVGCNLDASQTRHLLKHGINDCIVKAITEKAAAVGWVAPSPSIWNSSPELVEVSVEQCFPQIDPAD